VEKRVSLRRKLFWLFSSDSAKTSSLVFSFQSGNHALRISAADTFDHAGR
jgi:hypothetical protein